MTQKIIHYLFRSTCDSLNRGDKTIILLFKHHHLKILLSLVYVRLIVGILDFLRRNLMIPLLIRTRLTFPHRNHETMVRPIR